MTDEFARALVLERSDGSGIIHVFYGVEGFNGTSLCGSTSVNHACVDPATGGYVLVRPTWRFCPMCGLPLCSECTSLLERSTT